MKHEITKTHDRVQHTHSVSLSITDAPDYEVSYTKAIIAPERVHLSWTKYDDEDWGSPRIVITGRNRLKSGGLGAERRDNYASVRKAGWLRSIVEEVQPS